MNAFCKLRFRLRNGRWCTHPPDSRHAALIDVGMRKMWWCGDCDVTEFSTSRRDALPRPLNPPNWGPR